MPVHETANTNNKSQVGSYPDNMNRQVHIIRDTKSKDAGAGTIQGHKKQLPAHQNEASVLLIHKSNCFTRIYTSQPHAQKEKCMKKQKKNLDWFHHLEQASF